DAASGPLAAGKVDVRELGQGMTDLVVDRALGDIATAEVRDRDAEENRRRGDREQLEAIPIEHHQVGAKALEDLGVLGQRGSGATGEADRASLRLQEGDTRGDRPAILLDLLHGEPEVPTW